MPCIALPSGTKGRSRAWCGLVRCCWVVDARYAATFKRRQLQPVISLNPCLCVAGKSRSVAGTQHKADLIGPVPDVKAIGSQFLAVIVGWLRSPG